jgi:transposase
VIDLYRDSQGLWVRITIGSGVAAMRRVRPDSDVYAVAAGLIARVRSGSAFELASAAFAVWGRR